MVLRRVLSNARLAIFLAPYRVHRCLRFFGASTFSGIFSWGPIETGSPYLIPASPIDLVIHR